MVGHVEVAAAVQHVRADRPAVRRVGDRRGQLLHRELLGLGEVGVAAGRERAVLERDVEAAADEGAGEVVAEDRRVRQLRRRGGRERRGANGRATEQEHAGGDRAERVAGGRREADVEVVDGRPGRVDALRRHGARRRMIREAEGVGDPVEHRRAARDGSGRPVPPRVGRAEADGRLIRVDGERAHERARVQRELRLRVDDGGLVDRLRAGIERHVDVAAVVERRGADDRAGARIDEIRSRALDGERGHGLEVREVPLVKVAAVERDGDDARAEVAGEVVAVAAVPELTAARRTIAIVPSGAPPPSVICAGVDGARVVPPGPARRRRPGTDALVAGEVVIVDAASRGRQSSMYDQVPVMNVDGDRVAGDRPGRRRREVRAADPEPEGRRLARRRLPG